jgi:hypothetical protein
MWLPTGENATVVTVPEWPLRDAIESPVTVFQSCSVLSPDPETVWFPSGDIATTVTLLECLAVEIVVPVIASQNRRVLSSDPETTRLPSKEIATALTILVWPTRDRIKAPVVAMYYPGIRRQCGSHLVRK